MRTAAITVLSFLLLSLFPASPTSAQVLSLTHSDNVNRTYLFTNVHWWESMDHQLTSIITLLSLAQNTSSIAVLPVIPSSRSAGESNKSLVGDYFDISAVQKLQPVTTLSTFLQSGDYQLLAEQKAGSIPFPKNSQEEYEARLGVLGKLSDTSIKLSMPSVDPEHTNHKCDEFSGTIHVVGDVRFIFLERVHFAHFCTEKFLPWWYDVRHQITPRKEYMDAAEHFLSDKGGGVSVVHVNDLMETQKERDEEEIERYARQIVDGLRKKEAIDTSMYVIHARNGKHVKRVIGLLRQEFENVYDCEDLFECGTKVPKDVFDPSLTESEYEQLFTSTMANKMLEWALSIQADVFIGNVHSPFSRNICLHRKTHGLPYNIIRGFGELRKVWTWNL